MTPTLWTISLLLRRSLSLSTHARLSTSAPATTSPTRCILYVPGEKTRKRDISTCPARAPSPAYIITKEMTKRK